MTTSAFGGCVVEGIASTDPSELGRGVRVHHDDEVEAVGLTRLDEQGDDVDHDRTGGGGRLQLRGAAPYSRMDQRLQVLPGDRVGEDDTPERRAVE
jgi:hypothetical protein